LQLLMLLQLLVLLDDRAVLHVLLDLGRHERAQAPRFGRRHKLHMTGRWSPAAAATALSHQVVAGLLQLLVVLQLQPVRGVAQKCRMMVVAVVMVARGLLRHGRLGPDDAHFAKVLVPHVPEVYVLVAVRADVLVAVRRFSRVPMLVRHFAAVLVVVHDFAGVDQRYALAGQLVRVHVIHVLRHFLRHHDDDPVVSAHNQKVQYCSWNGIIVYTTGITGPLKVD